MKTGLPRLALMACGAWLGCGSRSSLLGFDSAGGAGPATSTSTSTTSTGAGGTCGDTETDPANCGACGAVCSGSCTRGRCLVTLASNQMNVSCIAVDGESVYWATADLGKAGAIHRVARSGGPFSTVSMTSSAPWTCTMAVDSAFVYWADGSNGSLFKARKAGSMPTTLASGLGANYIAVDATSVYWTGQFAYPTKIPLDGGAPTQLADTYGSTGIARDGASVYWTRRGVNDSGTVQKVSLNGEGPITLAAGQDLPQGIAADGSSVFWTDYASGTVQKISRDGGDIVTLASHQFNASAIAVDEASVYWSTLGSLMKVPKTGGVPMILADSRPFDIALDATSVYWTDGSTIQKLTPK